MIRRIAVPQHALHKSYADAGGHADCFCVDAPRAVALSEFVEAFYTCPVFRIERFILAWAVRKPSTDAEARALAKGERTSFAAWEEEARSDSQLIMRDFMGMTLSWFMVDPAQPQQLYFGTAITTAKDGQSIPLMFRTTMGFHAAYSRVLLWSVVRKLTSV